MQVYSRRELPSRLPGTFVSASFPGFRALFNAFLVLFTSGGFSPCNKRQNLLKKTTKFASKLRICLLSFTSRLNINFSAVVRGLVSE